MVLAVAMAANPAFGQQAEGQSSPPGTFGVQIENDIFSGTDNHYTHGTRISYVTPEGEVPDWVAEASAYLPGLPEGGKRRVGFVLGQNMYTPNDLRVEALQPDDRPYAGWLYGGVALLIDNGTELDAWQLEGGVVGPWSLAAPTQRIVHEVIQSQQPMGWSHQLRNEPGFILSYEKKWRNIPPQADGLTFDITPHVGGSIGNIMSYGAAGAAIRFGDGVPYDYGPPRIRPSLPGSAFFQTSAPEGTTPFGWYVFAGIEGRYMLNNIFLDGNTFQDSHSVDKIPLVADLQAGLAIILDRWRVTYTHVLRTREFHQQDRPDRFGAVSISVNF